MGVGKVFLVGAGPGDPDLITVKARKVIKRAEVLIYDYLATSELVDLAPEGAEKIYVGKKGGAHTLPQEEINKLLVEKAKEGKLVVRLKGGDPFLFGRGGEEAEVLAKEGIPFEVVPGITSAIAVPAYAGIPVTHRDFTSTLAIITGHEAEGKEESSINFEALSQLGTLVFLMGMKNLPFIVKRLVECGKSEETPVAVIRWGTTERQKAVTGTLKDIVEKVREAGLKAPAIIVIGEVVRLRERLSWFEKKPLFGKRILITRTRKQASKLSERLKELGARCYQVPTIEIKPIKNPEVKEEIKKVTSYDWLIFTSENGVEVFFERLFEEGLDVRALSRLKIAVIGSATKEKLFTYGIKADLFPERSFTQEGLLEAFASVDLTEKKVLIARAAKARDVLPKGLEEKGALVKVLPIYETLCPESSKERLNALLREGVDVITFTSSSTVQNFFKLLGEEKELLSGVKLASIGPITSQTLREFGYEPHIEAELHTIEGLVEAILKYFVKEEEK
jgi:uroporphyrinogen III methyltransferase/synthase